MHTIRLMDKLPSDNSQTLDSAWGFGLCLWKNLRMSWGDKGERKDRAPERPHIDVTHEDCVHACRADLVKLLEDGGEGVRVGDELDEPCRHDTGLLLGFQPCKSLSNRAGGGGEREGKRVRATKRVATVFRAHSQHSVRREFQIQLYLLEQRILRWGQAKYGEHLCSVHSKCSGWSGRVSP